MHNKKYAFSWDLLGDIEVGRPNLGKMARVEVYRLMQFTFRDVLETELGTAKADELFYAAGKLAGDQFFAHFFGHLTDFTEFVRSLQDVLKSMGIGILRIEQASLEEGRFVLTIAEDLDCSGLPELDFEVCKYDEGFISGIMEGFTGKKFEVKEIDCWCTGDRVCRFSAQAIPH